MPEIITVSKDLANLSTTNAPTIKSVLSIAISLVAIILNAGVSVYLFTHD